MAAAALASGTSRAFVGVALAAMLAMFYVSACSASKKDDSQTLHAVAENAKDDDIEDDDGRIGPPHPKHATASDTRTFLTTSPQPSVEKIAECIEQVTTLANEAGNQDDMVTAPEALKALVAIDTTLYHFCFYQLVNRLDERLAIGGPLMGELATVFFDTMKALWIMARALDRVTGQDRYFTYLRARYVQMSQDYFGRDVQVVAPPLGRPRPPEPAKGPGQGKPAASVPTE